MPIDTELRQQIRQEMIVNGARARRGQQEIPTAGAVVVLSAPSREDEETPENVARIETGIDIWRILIERQNVDLETSEVDWCWTTRLILNGDSQQVHMMDRVTKRLICPKGHPAIVLVDAGPQTGERAANTKTQLLAQGKLVWRPLIIVTSDYHAARVARTASRYLPPTYRFRVFPVPGVPNAGETMGALLARQEAEVTKILRYVAAGEIDRDVPPARLL